MIEIRAPYGTTYALDVFNPATGNLEPVEFRNGVAELEDNDPRSAVFRGMAPARRGALTYTVKQRAAA